MKVTVYNYYFAKCFQNENVIDNQKGIWTI